MRPSITRAPRCESVAKDRTDPGQRPVPRGDIFPAATELFTAADSGSASTEIVYQNYPGETPVFSGGMRVQNWTNTGGNTWKTTLPASTQYFENLFYNGVRRLARLRLGRNSGHVLPDRESIYLNRAGAAGRGAECELLRLFCGQRLGMLRPLSIQPADPIVNTWKNLAPAAGNPCGQPAGNPALAGDIELLDFEQFSTPNCASVASIRRITSCT